jgi:hypothetical protein
MTTGWERNIKPGDIKPVHFASLLDFWHMTGSEKKEVEVVQFPWSFGLFPKGFTG